MQNILHIVQTDLKMYLKKRRREEKELLAWLTYLLQPI